MSFKLQFITWVLARYQEQFGKDINLMACLASLRRIPGLWNRSTYLNM